jgi:beta-lactamase regulating signal transducer with metallopeptidase domain
MNGVITKILTMSIVASVVILLVLVLRLALRKMPKAFSYALWAVVLFRLLCPVSLSSNMSLFRLFDTPNAATEYVEPASHVGGTVTGSVRNENGGVAVKDEVPEIEVKAKPVREITPAEVLTFVWLAGVLGMAGYSLVKYVQLRKRLREAVPLRDNIYIADHIDTAFVMGLVRPKIYIPSSVEDRDMTHIIAHEEYHIRRLDHVTKFLAYGALCIHWFNPLVWAAFILSGNDMEMSCDEAVIRKLGEGVKAEYSASLLALTTGRQIIAGTPLAFAEGNAKGRILNLANMKRPRAWISLILALSCLLFTVACGTNSKPATPPKKEEAETETETAQITDTATEGTVVSAETTSKKEPIVLTDPYAKPDWFEDVNTPYELFQKITAANIKEPYTNAKIDGEYWKDSLISPGKLSVIFKGIKESEIQEYAENERPEWTVLGSDAELTFECEDGILFFWYEHDHVNLSVGTYDYKVKTKPDFYGGVRWKITNDALNGFFEDCLTKYGGTDGPELIELSKSDFSASVYSISDYWFETDSDTITLTLDGGDSDEGRIYLHELGSDGNGNIINVLYVVGNSISETYTTTPGCRYRIDSEGISGGTITLS